MNRSPRIKWGLLIIVLVLAGKVWSQQTLTISNAEPRLDQDGNIVDAHDGRIIKFKDRFYWYGTSYGNTNGFTTANHYVCYSSDDMMHWKKEGKLLVDQPLGVYYRPHVVYNEATRKYVLWYNWYPKLWDGQFGVAISDKPQGPFKIVNDNVKMAKSAIGLGDFGLFVDDDKTAYISYNTIQNHQVSVEKLGAEYTSSTLNNGGVIAEHMEAGSMFKRDGKYYLLTDYTCCFCNYGSGARVYISNGPLSGYKFSGNINRYPGQPVGSLTDGIFTGNLFETISKKENAWQGIELWFDEPSDFQKLAMHLFTGNRPENCGNVDNPQVHPPFKTPEFEISIWSDGAWKEVGVNKVVIDKRALNEVVTLDLDKSRSNRLRIMPSKFSMDHLHLSEIQLEDTKDVKAYITGTGISQRPIIPAQQTYIMELNTADGSKFIWMGDLWGSASDNVKGHDYQYWSAPLEFDKNGYIKPMEWTDTWNLNIKN